MRRIGLLVLVAVIAAMAAQHTIFDGNYTWEGSQKRVDNNFQGPTTWNKGSLYRRLEILEKPTGIKACFQLCVWSGGGETCSDCRSCKFANTGDVTYYKTEPATWWKKAPPDWSDYGIRAYLVKEDIKGGKWLATGGGAWVMGSSAASHIPIKMKITEILITGGDKLACPDGWGDAPAAWNCGGAVSVAQGNINGRFEGADVTRQPNGIEIASPELNRVVVVCIDGRVVKNYLPESGKVMIDKRGLLPGIYLIRTSTGQSSFATRMLVK